MNTRIYESEMVSRLKPGAVLLPPLVIRSSHVYTGAGNKGPDAIIDVSLPGETEEFRFVVESKADATPRSVKLAVAQARAAIHPGEHPMIQVPYLSAERLEELEREGMSGVDICGNGVVIIPGRLWVIRSGKPNPFRYARPLSNPYSGRSAIVARMFLLQERWRSLVSLTEAIRERGTSLSLAQASRAVRAMQDDLIVTKEAGSLVLQEPLRLLDQLAKAWKRPHFRSRRAFRLPPATEWASALSSNDQLKWAVTGESSASRYVTFGQGGPLRVAVSNLENASTLLRGTPEPVPSFAEVELLETDEPGFFFASETDEKGIRWASRLQTWLELQAGDARQQHAARDLRTQLLKGVER